MANLALLDLVLPYVLRDENLGANHALLSILRVVHFETATDAFGIALRGHCELNGQLSLDPSSGTLTASTDEATPAHDPSRSDPIFDLADTSVDFEVFVPRVGSQIITQAQPSFSAAQQPVTDLFNNWQSATPSDYPSSGFTLDLILNAPKLRPPFLHPAKVSAIGVLEPDPSHQEVALTLPRLRFRITHGNPNPSNLVLSFASAGVSSLDDPGSTSVSELISMDPPYAYIGADGDHVVGFGFRSATLDLDQSSTPPAIAAKTGIGDDWTGLYLPEARFFVAPDGLRNLAFECGAQELLIGVGKSAGVWGDFEAALVQQGSGDLTINPRFDAGTVGSGGRSYAVTLTGTTAGVRQATANVPQHSTLVIDVTGGRTPYTRSVKINGTAQPPATMYDVDLGSAGTATIDIEVTSSGSSAAPAKMHIDVTQLTAQSTLTVPGQPTVTPQDAQLGAHDSTFTYQLLSSADADTVTLTTVPPDTTLTWHQAAGTPAMADSSGSAISFSLAASESRTFSVSGSGAPGSTAELDYYFFYDCPGGGSSTAMSTQPAVDKLHQVFGPGGQDPSVAYHSQLDALPTGATLTIQGDASYEGDPSKEGYNTSLAWRRAQAVQAAIQHDFPSKGFTFVTQPQLANPQLPTQAEQDAWATAVGWTSHAAPNDNQHWRATVSFTSAATPSSGNVEVHRPAPTSTPTTQQRPPTDPPVPEASPPPDWFRSVKAKVRVVDSQVIAVELDLEVDFQTYAEQRLQGQMGGLPAGTQIPRGRTLDHGTPVGPSNPADGITLFRVLVQRDPATGRVDTLLSAGADPADTDGLLHMGWIPQLDPMPANKDLGLTFLGSYLSFWPLLAAAPPVDAARDAAEGHDGAVVEAVLSGAALAAPGIIAALPWFSIERIILFGAEYFHTQLGSGFTGNLLVDVEMDWSLDILDLVKIARDKPLKVRYKAIGVRLTNRDVPPGSPPGTPEPDRWNFLPIFDASRGYTIDVAGGGGGMQIGDPLGKILRIAGARLSRSNPMTLEVDIALGVDLGVVSVDQASVRAYLDGSAPPELTALSAKVDIPGALVGSGYMRISDTPDGKVIGGQLDLTIRPVNVRVAAAVEVANVHDGTRTATAVYVGLNVVLPAGIPLGSTGLGIFGFRGIFGMHYRRTELTDPSTSVPALAWLKKAGGQPHLLQGPAPDHAILWEPKIDNWAFGVGILIGTMEGGVILNLDGTFLLELPGPRVLIMMNARIVSPPPSVGQLGMKGGVLAVIEITPDHFLIGILVQWDIKDLIKIVIPVEAVFPFGSNSQDWHIYLGARHDYGPSVEVDVLGIVKGSGYLMFRGKDLTAYAVHGGNLPALQGFSIALGVAAGFTWGSRSAGIYLSISGGMDAELGFDPFTLAGNIWVSGELRLWIVSIGADANLEVIVAEQSDGHPALSVDGQACGHVSLLFFEVSGCVHVSISGPKPTAAIPTLVEKLSLQSRSPALAQGTGVDKGIDVSLGRAVEQDARPSDDSMPVVPIDSIPVISFLVPPSPDGSVTIGGLGTPLTAAPGVDASGYAVRSAEEYKYQIVGLRLERIDADGSVDAVTLAGGDAPATWWTINDPTTPNPNAQLALLTYQVSPATKAIEYSDKLVDDVTRRWGTVCDPAAPPAEVLWTFKLEPLGPSDTGWDLEGIAWPDPSNTHRGDAPVTALRVSEPWRTGTPALDALRGVVPAYVIGGVVPCHRRRRLPDLTGIDLGMTLREKTLEYPMVVRDGVGAIDRLRPSGQMLSVDDPVHQLLTASPIARDVRISGALYDKAAAALPGLRAITKAGDAGYSFNSLLADLKSGTPITRDISHHALATMLDVAAPDVISIASRSGVRCAVKVLAAPQFDFGRATNFPDPQVRRRLAGAGVKDESRDLVNMVRLETGGFGAISILVLIPLRQEIATHLSGVERIVAEVRAVDGSLLDRVQVTDADLLSNGRALPADWTDLAGPWGYDVADLLVYAQQKGLAPALLQLSDQPDAAHVDLGEIADVYKLSHADLRGVEGLRSYQLAAVSMTSQAEIDRSDWDQTQRDEDKQRLVKATGPDASNYALLKENSTYRLVVDWHAERKSDGVTLGDAATPQQQTFWFRTDTITAPTADQPTFDDRTGDPIADTPTPVRLDPWVMMSLPEDNELSTFCDDPLRVVFNTPDVDRIFTEYGKELRLRLFAANGEHPAGLPTIDLSTLTQVAGVLKSPWDHAFDTMKQNGLPVTLPDGETGTRDAAPCVDVDGMSSSHSVLEVPVPFNPYMGYLLDVEMVDTGSPADARGPRVFRRHFTTGAFGSLGALAWSVSSTLPTAQFCPPGTFSSLWSTYGAHPEGSTIDSHLLAHQLSPWPAPERARVVVFWEQSGSADPQPAAVLIDATEALSRSRAYPKNVTDTTVPDAPQRWVLEQREWLTVATGGTTGVAGIVYAPGNHRAIIVLDAGSRGTHLTVDLVSPAMPDLPFLDTGGSTAPLIDLTLTRAPWEES